VRARASANGRATAGLRADSFNATPLELILGHVKSGLRAVQEVGAWVAWLASAGSPLRS
jgi:hypothetical protein